MFRINKSFFFFFFFPVIINLPIRTPSVLMCQSRGMVNCVGAKWKGQAGVWERKYLGRWVSKATSSAVKRWVWEPSKTHPTATTHLAAVKHEGADSGNFKGVTKRKWISNIQGSIIRLFNFYALLRQSNPAVSQLVSFHLKGLKLTNCKLETMFLLALVRGCGWARPSEITELRTCTEVQSASYKYTGSISTGSAPNPFPLQTATQQAMSHTPNWQKCWRLTVSKSICFFQCLTTRGDWPLSGEWPYITPAISMLS